MKTIFNIVTTLAVIALASADSNAICNGKIGNHANEIGGRDYISCVQKDNGEIVGEIQTCPNDQTFCPRTASCLASQECDIENHSSSESSSESDSSDSSSTSSSEENFQCSKPPTADPENCKNQCCPDAVFSKSGLFGSSFRGQIQTETCTPCEGDDTMFCKTTGQCEQVDSVSNPDCFSEVFAYCDCDLNNLERDPENCKNAMLVCKDINMRFPIPCQPDGVFSDEIKNCVYPADGDVYVTVFSVGISSK